MGIKLVNVPMAVAFRRTPCEWEVVKASEEDAGLAVYRRKGMSRGDKYLNAWTIRSEFLALDSTPRLAKFLKATGVFHLYTDYFKDLVEWQTLIRRLMVTSPEHWSNLADKFDKNKVRRVLQSQTSRCLFRWASGKAHACLWTTTTLEAIVATIHVDHLRGATFRFCMKPDCGQGYEVTSGHSRMYCSQQCAHHMSVRRNRERLRKQRLARKGYEILPE